MSVAGEVPVAVVMTRSTLDLAINFWIPGYLARTITDADDALDLTVAGGLLVLDPADPLTPPMLEHLHERGVSRPVVLLGDDAAELSELGPAPAGPIICSTGQVPDLARAFDAATGVDDAPEDEEPSDEVALEESGAALDDSDVALDERDIGGDGTSTGGPQQPPVSSWTAQGPMPLHGAAPVAEQPAPRPEAAHSGDRPRRSDRRREHPGPLRRLLDRLQGADGRATQRGPVGPGGAPELEPEEGTSSVPGQEERSRTDTGDGADASVDRVLELEPDLDAQVRLAAWPIARCWLVLDALANHIRSGAALVAVRTTTGSYSVVAGTGIAPLDADQVIPSTHPLLERLRTESGWWVRGRRDDDAGGPRLPLRECDALLALAVPGTDDALQALVLIGRLDGFDTDEAAAAAFAVVQSERVPSRLQIHAAQEAGGEPDRAAGTAAGRVPAVTVRSGWRLLDAAYPLLGGASAVLMLRGGGGTFVPTAATGLDPRSVAAVLAADDPLLHRLRAAAGPMTVQSAGDDAQAVSKLPVAGSAFIAFLPRGPADAPDAVLLLGRRDPFSEQEIGELHRAVLAHEPAPDADLAQRP